MSRPVLRASLTAAVLFALVASARGGTLYVANDGFDPPHCVGCGAKTSPCRSISCALRLAGDGDKIIVGPGKYGDLNGNGALNEAGEEQGESYAPGCGCMIAVNKAISITSSDGAAATYLDAQTVNIIQNVLVIASAELGKPGKGFTVTSTQKNTSAAIVVDASNVKVHRNQVVGGANFPGFGIDTVDAPETVLIQGNQVVGPWTIAGIRAQNANKTVL